MKKETDNKKHNNRVIWEEFVSKNKIKKNYSSGGNINFNFVNHRASNELEELKSHPKADIKKKAIRKKKLFWKIYSKFSRAQDRHRYREEST